MKQVPTRWPVISFLELFCCALGGAAILLILINREISSDTEFTRMLRVTARVQLPGEGEPTLDLIREGAATDEDRISIGPAGPISANRSGLWGSGEIQKGNSGRSLFFVCDVRGRTGTYTLRISQEAARYLLPADQVADDRVLRDKLKEAREAVMADSSLKKLHLVIQLLIEWIVAGEVNHETFGKAWKAAMGQSPPPRSSANEYLQLIRGMRNRIGQVSGTVCRQYALAHLLLLVAEANSAAEQAARVTVKVKPQELMIYTRSDEAKLDSLWSDLMSYLAIRLGPSRERYTFELEGSPIKMPSLDDFSKQKYGHFSLIDDLTPHPIGSMKDVGEAFTKVLPVEWGSLDPLWLEVSEILCRPRDLHLWIDWGSIPKEERLGGERLRPQRDQDSSRIYYELSIRLTPDEVTVDTGN